MEIFDSDATYCSEAEYNLKKNTKGTAENVSNFPNVRRSQRLLKSPKESNSFTWDDYRINKRGKLVQIKKRKNLGMRTRSSSQFLSKNIVECSQTLADIKKPSTNAVIIQSMDLLQELQTPTMSYLIPPNQNYQLPHCSGNHTVTASEPEAETIVNLTAPIDLRVVFKNDCESSQQNVKIEEPMEPNLIINLCSSQLDTELTHAVTRGKVINYSTANNHANSQNVGATQGENVSNADSLVSDTEHPPPIQKERNNKRRRTCKVLKKSNKLKFEHGTKKPLQKRARKQRYTLNSKNKEIPNKYIDLKEFLESRKNDNWYTKCSTCRNFTEENSILRSPIKTPVYELPASMSSMPPLPCVGHSMLPAVYPPHFIHQKPPIAVQPATVEPTPIEPNFIASTMKSHTATQNTLKCKSRSYCVKNLLTPELSEPSDVDMDNAPSPSSSISLTDSLKDIFGSNDLRTILKIDKVQYRLTGKHVKALALVLNIDLECLRQLLNTILRLDKVILTKIDKTVENSTPSINVAECETLARNSVSPANSFVACSQSPERTESRHFPSQRQTM